MRAARLWVAPVTRINANYMLQAFIDARWSESARKAAVNAVAVNTDAKRAAFPSWYEFKVTPDPHQLAGLNKVWSLSDHALFMDRGTGKTKTSIDFVTAKAMAGEIDSCVIAAPLSMVLSWRDEILANSPVGSTITLYRRAKAREWSNDGLALSKPFHWMLVSIESMSTGGTVDWLKAWMLGKRSWMLVDESARIKNPNAKRTANITSAGMLAAGRSILSGLPVLIGPIDLFSQFEFINPQIIGAGDFWCFRNRYAVMGGYEGKQIVGYQHLDELTALIEPYTYSVTREQALKSLPPKRFKTIRVELAPPQLAAIASIRKGAIGDRVMKNVLERVLRMQQVTAGFITRPRKKSTDPLHGIELEEDTLTEIVGFEDNPKIAALRDILEDSSSQFIVWCNFIPEFDLVSRLLDALKISYVKYRGDVDFEARKDAEREFQSGAVRGFVGTLGTGGIGITLTAASLVIYFGNSWALEMREQSEDRAHRRGQKNAVLYIDLIAEGSVDELIMDALKNKRDVAEYVRMLIEQKAALRGYDYD